MIRALMLCLFCGWLAGCAVNPATGRTDFVMMSERQELDLGARYNQEILKQYPRYEDAKLQAYIQRVGERVARSSHRNQLNYVFTLVDSRTSMPSRCRAATSISIVACSPISIPRRSWPLCLATRLVT